jgi:hypothetical protein
MFLKKYPDNWAEYNGIASSFSFVELIAAPENRDSFAQSFCQEKAGPKSAFHFGGKQRWRIGLPLFSLPSRHAFGSKTFFPQVWAGSFFLNSDYSKKFQHRLVARAEIDNLFNKLYYTISTEEAYNA